MEAAVANVVSEGCRAVVVVTGYFGDRLVQIIERYGAHVRRIDVEWGRAVDPALLRARAEDAKARTSSASCTRKRPPASSTR